MRSLAVSSRSDNPASPAAPSPQATYPLHRIPFEGGEIHVTQDAAGAVFVLVRRVCQHLGLAPTTVLKRLRVTAWARTVTLIIPGAGRGVPARACLPLDALGTWLGSLRTPRATTHRSAELLGAYQRGAVRAVTDYFAASTTTSPTAPIVAHRDPKPENVIPTLVRVPIHDAELHAVQVGADVWVSIRRTCEDLGVSPQGQLERLAKKPWASIKMILTQIPGDDQRREIACLPLDSLPMWLATIEPSRVAETARPRLVLYQREAARVLRDHFLGRPAAPSALPAQENWTDTCPARTSAAMLALGDGVPAGAVVRVLAQPPDLARSEASWVLEMARGTQAPARPPREALVQFQQAMHTLGASNDTAMATMAIADIRAGMALLAGRP